VQGQAGQRRAGRYLAGQRLAGKRCAEQRLARQCCVEQRRAGPNPAGRIAETDFRYFYLRPFIAPNNGN